MTSGSSSSSSSLKESYAEQRTSGASHVARFSPQGIFSRGAHQRQASDRTDSNMTFSGMDTHHYVPIRANSGREGTGGSGPFFATQQPPPPSSSTSDNSLAMQMVIMMTSELEEEEEDEDEEKGTEMWRGANNSSNGSGIMLDEGTEMSRGSNNSSNGGSVMSEEGTEMLTATGKGAGLHNDNGVMSEDGMEMLTVTGGIVNNSGVKSEQGKEVLTGTGTGTGFNNGGGVMSSEGEGSALLRRQYLTAGERTVGLTAERINQCFHLSLREAAVKLDVGVTVLKRVCRRLGINRWPHTKVARNGRRKRAAASQEVQLPIVHDTAHASKSKTRNGTLINNTRRRILCKPVEPQQEQHESETTTTRTTHSDMPLSLNSPLLFSSSSSSSSFSTHPLSTPTPSSSIHKDALPHQRVPPPPTPPAMSSHMHSSPPVTPSSSALGSGYGPGVGVLGQDCCSSVVDPDSSKNVMISPSSKFGSEGTMSFLSGGGGSSSYAATADAPGHLFTPSGSEVGSSGPFLSQSLLSMPQSLPDTMEYNTSPSSGCAPVPVSLNKTTTHPTVASAEYHASGSTSIGLTQPVPVSVDYTGAPCEPLPSSLTCSPFVVPEASAVTQTSPVNNSHSLSVTYSPSLFGPVATPPPGPLQPGPLPSTASSLPLPLPTSLDAALPPLCDIDYFQSEAPLPTSEDLFNFDSFLWDSL